MRPSRGGDAGGGVGVRLAPLAALVLAGCGPAVAGGTEPVRIAIDAAANRHPINPAIYGASFPSVAAAHDLGLALARSGGNSASLYDWQTEARSAGRDWFFESLPITADDPAQYGERFVERARAAGAVAMLTVPMTGRAARLAPDGGKMASFSVIRYGVQQATDAAGLADAGNGVRPDGSPIIGNDPDDATRSASPAEQRDRIARLVARFGPARAGGVRYYLMDNEVTRWHDIHRDVRPVGVHAAEQARMTIDYARLVKTVDPGALVVAPEEWGWGGYRYSGFDQQIGDAHGYNTLPDRTGQTGGMDLLPWLLTQWKRAGHPVDVVSVHFYPQGGEFRADGHDDVSPAMQALRNRSTRSLWDPTYLDTSWIADRVALIPRLRGWVDRYYDRGTPIAITEYDWGAAEHMNGATAQADVLGIFGREGLDIAARWMTPPTGSPAYLAMKLFRNPDGHHTGFGETSVTAGVPDPDTVAAFAALRHDGALTVIAINKVADAAAPVIFSLAHVAPRGHVTGTRLERGALRPLPTARYASADFATTLPPQSVTLFEFRPDAR